MCSYWYINIFTYTSARRMYNIKLYLKVLSCNFCALARNHKRSGFKGYVHTSTWQAQVLEVTFGCDIYRKGRSCYLYYNFTQGSFWLCVCIYTYICAYIYTWICICVHIHSQYTRVHGSLAQCSCGLFYGVIKTLRHQICFILCKTEGDIRNFQLLKYFYTLINSDKKPWILSHTVPVHKRVQL
jgi:hypothetical protein